MIGYQMTNPSDDVLQFGTLLADLLTKVANVEIPKNIYNFFLLQELIPIFKKHDESTNSIDYRPICMISTYRKLIAAAAIETTVTFNSKYFKQIQYAFEKTGMEKLINVYKYIIKSTNADIVKCDGTNAFGNINRIRILYETKNKFPMLYPLVKALYTDSTNMVIYGFSSGIQQIEANDGVLKGCPLSSWLFSIGIQPFLLAH